MRCNKEVCCDCLVTYLSLRKVPRGTTPPSIKVGLTSTSAANPDPLFGRPPPTPQATAGVGGHPLTP
jgi:hypothetical protein